MVIVVAAVSEAKVRLDVKGNGNCPCRGPPLFSVPQTSQVNRAFMLPEAPSRRFPQSVQNTSDPIAVMFLIAV